MSAWFLNIEFLDRVKASFDLPDDNITKVKTNEAAGEVYYLGDGSPPAVFRKGEDPQFSGGWVVFVGYDGVQIWSDPVGSVPLYIQQSSNGFRISDSAGSLLKGLGFDKTIDRVGFWQSLIYESPLKNRTLFKGFWQVTAGQCVSLTKDGGFDVRNYWFPGGDAMLDLTWEEAVAEGARLCLEVCEREMNADAPYIVPLSGGVDSRLAVILARRYVSPDQIQALTYASHRGSMELVLAKRICAKLALRPPIFHQLQDQHYLDACEWLPLESAGMIPFVHMHLLSHLRTNKDLLEGKRLLSTVFSDALFGYAATSKTADSADPLFGSGYARRLMRIGSWLGLESSITEETIEDLRSDLELSRQSSLTSLDDYLYVMSRTSKFHFPLVRSWKKHIDIDCLFDHPEMAKFFFSINPEFRVDKKIEIAIVKLLHEDIGKILTFSSLLQSGRTEIMIDKLLMRGINFLNAGLRYLNVRAVEIPNPYQTERQAQLLHTVLRDRLAEGSDYLLELGLVNEDQRNILSKPLIRFGDRSGSQLTAISHSRFFKNIDVSAVGGG